MIFVGILLFWQALFGFYSDILARFIFLSFNNFIRISFSKGKTYIQALFLIFTIFG